MSDNEDAHEDNVTINHSPFDIDNTLDIDFPTAQSTYIPIQFTIGYPTNSSIGNPTENFVRNFPSPFVVILCST
ncbi:unnamed protein product [Cunninghamella echinulata]